jgi:Enoyl-CoA hydratase/carnithine racemase
MNAYDPETFEELSDALVDFRDDDNLGVAIITGAGEKAFIAGADIKTILPYLAERPLYWEKVPTIMRGLELYKPLIAAINGFALGGGLETALACDIRIASENAMFGVPEVTLGIIPGWGGTQRLPRCVPWAMAAQMLFTGKPISAQEAYRIGLVNRVVPITELMPAAEAMAKDILRVAPLAVKAAKQAMFRGMNMSLEEGLKVEADLMAPLFASEDHVEGRNAFLEKRKPEFKGK